MIFMWTFNVLFSLRDKVKKLTTEKDVLESHLKNEKDEKELYKVKSFWMHFSMSDISFVTLTNYSITSTKK